MGLKHKSLSIIHRRQCHFYCCSAYCTRIARDCGQVAQQQAFSLYWFRCEKVVHQRTLHIDTFQRWFVAPNVMSPYAHLISIAVCVCVCEREIERHRENEHQYVIVYIWFSTRQSLVWQYFALFFTSILYSAWVGREIKTKHGFIYRVWNKDRFLLKMLCKCVFKIRLLNLHKLIFTSPDKELTKRENWNFPPRWIKHLFCSTIEYR